MNVAIIGKVEMCVTPPCMHSPDQFQFIYKVIKLAELKTYRNTFPPFLSIITLTVPLHKYRYEYLLLE